MKKILLALTVVFFTIGAAQAQKQDRDKSVNVSDIELVQSDGYVAVTFKFHAGKKVTQKDYNLVINPVLQNGWNQLQLPSIVVRGKRSKVSEERHALVAGYQTYDQRPFYTANGQTLDYGIVIPYEAWMSGSQLVFQGVSVGCCSATEAGMSMIADNLLYAEPEIEIEIVEVREKLTGGDRMARQFAFVVPNEQAETKKKSSSQFDYNMPLRLGQGMTTARQNEVDRFVEETREGSLSILFRQGKREIDRNFADNNRALVELVSTVRAIHESEDSRIVRIVIAGFASPEGTLAFNDRLAWDRAVAVKTFLTANSGIKPEMVSIYNGSVDWMGLRELVAQSDMYEKYRIMEIIDNTPIWDSYRKVGRHGELMRLNSGTPYRYMLANFFPRLRQAAYIKVYYENN